MPDTWVRSLGWEDSLEKEMATHSSTLAWKIPWTEEPGRLQSVGSQRMGQDWVTSLSKYLISNFMLVAYWNCIYLANTVLLSIMSNGLNVLSGKFKKSLINSKLYLVLGSLMKSHPARLCRTQYVNHRFVSRVPPISRLGAILVIRSTVVLSQGLCSSESYCT